MDVLVIHIIGLGGAESKHTIACTTLLPLGQRVHEGTGYIVSIHIEVITDACREMC